MGWLNRKRDQRTTDQPSTPSEWQAQALSNPPRVMRDYDARRHSRDLDSFTYHYEERWSGETVDDLYTDHREEVDRMIPRSLDQAYDVRVTGPNGVEHHTSPHNG